MFEADQVIIYHNPRCSKSRATLELLKSHGVEPSVIHYLDAPPSTTEMKEILRRLNLEPRALMRTKEAAYRAQGLDDPALSSDALIAGMLANPSLIERPIVLAHGKAAVGRPPENVISIL